MSDSSTGKLSEKNERHNKRMARKKEVIDAAIAASNKSKGLLLVLTGNGKKPALMPVKKRSSLLMKIAIGMYSVMGLHGTLKIERKILQHLKRAGRSLKRCSMILLMT